MSHSQMSRYAKADPAHFLDGLWVPTAQKGQALYDVESEWDGQYIRFEGVQLSCTHQSLLLAIAARSARSEFGAGRTLDKESNSPLVQTQLSLLDVKGLAVETDFSDLKCSVYGLLVDAGMETSQNGYDELIRLLHQMSTVQMYRGKSKGISPSKIKENDRTGGTSQLLAFQHDEKGLDGLIFISLNWRMTRSILNEQNVQISLHERKQLNDSPVAKILHAWLSSAIQLNGQLMAGHGADLNSLVRHVYGKRPCSDETLRQRRGFIKTALARIDQIKGWVCAIEGGHVYVSRPKELPWVPDEKTVSPKPKRTRKKAE